MNTSSDIWFSFARSVSVLFLVLALLIFVFYLIKKVSMAKGVRGGQGFIKVLSVHHLSPKEKLVLLNLLIGVTPSQISKISSLEHEIDLSEGSTGQAFTFSDFLTQKLGSPFKGRAGDGSGNEEK